MHAEHAQTMHALGRDAAARAEASAAYVAYRPLKTDAYSLRAGLLVQAQLALANLEVSNAAEAVVWRTRAADAYQAASKLQGLVGEHAAWFAALK